MLDTTFGIPPTYRRWSLASGTASDPSSRALAISDTDTAISINLSGGWATTDPLAGVSISWEMKDGFGAPLLGTDEWNAGGLLIARSIFPAEDVAVVLLLLNDSNVATADGVLGGLRRVAGSAMNIRAGGYANGAVNNLSDDGASAGSLLQAWMPWSKTGVGSGGVLSEAYGRDGSGTVIAADLALPSTFGGATWGASRAYLHLCAYRTNAANVNAAAVSVDVWTCATRHTGAKS